jgi:AcrR family transcriptional regulator
MRKKQQGKAGQPRGAEPRRGTAARILEAADELFCRSGYDGVSARDIAVQARVNKALVFYHFGSKEELFAQVVGRYYDAHRRALEGSFEGGGPLRARLHRMFDAYFDFMAEHRRYAALIQHEAANPKAHPLIRRNLAPMLGWIERVLAEAVPGEGPLASRHFFVTFSGAVINYFTYAPLLAPAWKGDPLAPAALEERRRHVHFLVDAVLDALGRG